VCKRALRACGCSGYAAANKTTSTHQRKRHPIAIIIIIVIIISVVAVSVVFIVSITRIRLESMINNIQHEGVIIMQTRAQSFFAQTIALPRFGDLRLRVSW